MDRELEQIILRIDAAKTKAKELGRKNKRLLADLAQASAIVEQAKLEAAKIVEENRKVKRRKNDH
jgi:hypothetical protein